MPKLRYKIVTEDRLEEMMYESNVFLSDWYDYVDEMEIDTESDEIRRIKMEFALTYFKVELRD